MEPIESIEDDIDASRLINPQVAPTLPQVSDLNDQMDRLKRLQAIGDEAKILADAADTLYIAEVEDGLGVLDMNIDTPDDDRASGRMEYTRLDLLSE